MLFFFDRRDFNKKLSLFLAALLVALPLLSTNAQAGGIIRDAETEKLIRDYARPIFRAAGLYGQNVKIHIIASGSFNAFVIDGQNMFIHTGAIVNSKTPNQLIGVIAHETGHITGGHLASLRSQLKKAQARPALMFQILEHCRHDWRALRREQAVWPGRRSCFSEAVTLCSKNRCLPDRRIKESSADRAAVTFLNARRISPPRACCRPLNFSWIRAGVPCVRPIPICRAIRWRPSVLNNCAIWPSRSRSFYIKRGSGAIAVSP